MSMAQYMSVFTDEAKEHLQLLNDAMLKLERNPEDIQIIEEIFRSAHTLKGMSATMGFNKTAELTHHMENVLDLIRNEKLDVDERIVDVLFECLDALSSLIDELIETGQEETESEQLSKKLEKIAKGDQEPEPTTSNKKEEKTEVKKSESSPSSGNGLDIELNEFEKQLLEEAKSQAMNLFGIKVILDDGCLLKAARTYMVFRNLEEMGEIIKSEPSAEDLEEEKFDDSFLLTYITKKSESEIDKAIMSISEVNRAEITSVSYEEAMGVKPPEKEEVQEEKTAAKAPTSKPSKPAKAPAGKKAEPKEASKPAPKKTTTVRVDTHKLDQLMNLMAELVINKTRLAQISADYNLQDLSETMSAIDRVSSDLQAVVTKVRMVPIETVFNRFPRMVRDLAKDLGKEIDLQIEGKETELDRTVIDEIGDPLVHLIRNSLDHGVETPEVRRESGKPEQGTVLLKAEHEGNSVVITISDDGKGIDPEFIARKAVEKELVTEEDTVGLTDKEKLNFIFASGFSTADQVTDVSGRGVGMDVVKNKIEGINGNIEMTSEVGKGSVTRVKLPLTLAIIEALLVRLKEEIFAIPLANIVETLDIEKKDIKVVQNEDVFVLRGEVIPIIDLGKILEVPEYEIENTDNFTVVIVKSGDRKLGLIVDVLLGQQEVVIKTLGKLFVNIRGITGATVLGNGDVAIILDVLTLI